MPRNVTKPTTLSERLADHPFAMQVFDDNRQVMRTAFAPGKVAEVESQPLRDLTEGEWHIRACGFALSHLLGLVTQLAQVPAYIRQYHRTQSLASRGVTRASDITYHLENFLIRTQSLEDRTLQLCSAVLHTGLDLSSVSYHHMIKNVRVRSSELDVPLKAIHKLCQQYSRTRNQVIHQHGLLDGDLRRIELLLMGSRVMERDRRDAAARSYRFLVADLAERKTDELDDFTRSATGLCTELFSQLERLYLRSKARLSIA